MTGSRALVNRPRLLMVMPYRQLVRKAVAEGFWVAAIWDPALESGPYLDDVRRLADVFELADFTDEAALRRTIGELAARHDVTHVYHLGREDSMISTSEVAEQLRVGLNPASAVRLLTDKHAMRERLALAGLSPVRYAVAATRHDVFAALKKVGYPAVVKPTALSGSRAVFLWRDVTDQAAWTTLVDEYAYEGPFLVEEYLLGAEFSVETMSRDGQHQVVGITAKQLGPAPLFVEVGHIHPAPLPPEQREGIERLTTTFLTTCGYWFGPAHTEVIWTAAGPRIVESQARLGGDRIPRLVELSTGLDLERAVFSTMAGRVSPLATPAATAVVRFFTFRPGTVNSVGGLDAVRQLDHVDELTLALAAGDTVSPVRDSKSRHGHVIVSGPTLEGTLARLDRVLSMIDVVIDGEPARPDGADRAQQQPRVIFVGYNAAYLRAVEGKVPSGSIVVLEEPDIIRKRELADAPSRFDCLDRIVPVAYQQSANVLETGADLAAGMQIVAVVPGLEYAVLAAASLAAKLGLPGASQAAAQSLRDKLRLREAAQSAGVRNPRWREVHGPDDVLSFAGDGPVVLKPANRQASVGVVLLDSVNRAGAERAWATTTAAAEYEQVPDRELAWRYLVEERLYGPEYSVEALVRRGEVIFENVTAKTVIPGPHPVELGHLMPAPATPAVQAQFAEAIRTLVAALGFETGILHAEWILTEHGPTLVECAGRCPGDHIIDLVDLAYDTRIRLTLIDLLAGRPVDLPRTAIRAAAIRFLRAEPGEVESVCGAEMAASLPGVQEVEVDVVHGDTCHSWVSSWDRPGHVIATGPDAVTAQRHVLDAAAAVQIRTN